MIRHKIHIFRRSTTIIYYKGKVWHFMYYFPNTPALAFAMNGVKEELNRVQKLP
jgi:hypothetical protein